MGSLQLPPELEDLIIDYLHDDPATLAYCGLVCRSWLPSARFHLWGSLHFRCTAEDLTRLSSVLATSPAVAYYIHSVTITQGHIHVWNDLDRLHTTLSVLARLPNLIDLTLHGLCFAPPATDDEVSLGAHKHVFPTVRSLTINTCSFDAFEDARDLWSIFPALHTVRFDGVWWGRWTVNEGEVEDTSRSVRVGTLKWHELNLGGCFSRDAIVDWLLDSLAKDTVHTLRLPLVGIHDTRLKELLKHVGSSLQHLEIGSPSSSAARVYAFGGSVPRSIDSLLDLSVCPSLRTITLGVPVYQDATLITRWLATLLGQISSPDLEEVRFAVYPILHKDAADAFEILSAFDWDFIMRVLLGARVGFPSLVDNSSHSSGENSSAHAARFPSLMTVKLCLGRPTDYTHIPMAFVSLTPYLRKIAATFFSPLCQRGIEVRVDNGA